MSLIECNVIRYEIFLDEITPDTLSLAFLRDFLSLPQNFIEGKAKLQKFIIRYGTHFIKSAKFGGSFRLFKTQQASKSESIEDFSIQAQASYNGLFAVSGHMGMSQSSGASSSDKTSRTHVKLEGGDQKVASIVADFYSTGFKETFTEWLKSIPTYPKPVEMFMGTMSELLDMNYKLLFPFEIGDAADGCFSENLRTEEGTGRKYYEVATLVNNTQGVMTPVNEKRYCDVTSVDKFGEAMDQKRLALERAIVVYMEEGPVPTTDFRLEGGKPGCTSQALKVKGGTSGATFPTWLELINGETYKVIFDLPEGISYDITKNTEALIVFSRNRWNCHAPGTELHMYNSFKNGGSGDTNSKKVSCFGFVMTYLEESGTFVVTPPDHEASSRIFRDLPRSYINSNVARAEYVSPLEHAKAKGNALASIVEAPCSVKWSNSYQIKPAEEGERCLYFVAASKGDIFVVFSAIPRDMTTWYHLQISFQGVALYKGMKLVKYEGAKSARSLGDSKLFQPYFICLQEDMENMRTYIKYGIGSDTSEKGLVYMVYTDASPPLGIRFYSFGSGEESVEIMDARVIEGGTTEMECTGGTIMQDGMCVEDCHPECEGCIPMSPGSKLDTECRACKHLFVPLESGSTRCVAECPEGTALASDGRTCGTKWRADGKCGPSFPAPLATPGQCNKDSHQPCCSGAGECGDTADHCNCDDCVDYRCVGCAWLRGSSTWVEGFSGTSYAANGVTYDPAKALDGNTATNWNPVGKDRYYNDWYIVLDLEAAHKLTRIAVNNYGDTEHDVTAFTLQKSLSGSPYNWEDVVAVTDARVGTNQRQEFDGFEGTARYWKFTVKRTSSGWQPWLRDVNFYGISTEVNVAVGKTADQSSGRDGGGSADRAVDGNTDGNWGGGSCTHTEDEVGATWWVDLAKSETIQRVVLWNRRDCCGDRLNPFNIYIGDSDQITTNPKCGGDHRIDLSKPSVTVPCEGMQGRYVGIRLVGGWSRPLTLCEVQVFATRSDTSD
ncbi:PREDICTED: uncharacterized protein LOC109482870 isoform X1 [Branchiostoma belcheri]|uniref:Uncharacterized protein LOC109482870 isoform X1 n=1 Tax=Branchiostoma belcheri TaxID=7741 RepID=A0A6P4ZWL4_BRABE|nr:PREDICTED: uncharacterized protein LOC109482870 isoform X1 [Branchiostoma belcheri]